MASAWGSSWGSSWGISWGGAAPPVVAKRLGGTFGGTRHHSIALFRAIFEREIERLEAEEEPEEPAPPPIKRRIRAVRKAAMAEAGGLLGPQVAAVVEREVKRFYTPQVSIAELQASYDALVAKLIREQAEKDDEDVLLLM